MLIFPCSAYKTSHHTHYHFDGVFLQFGSGRGIFKLNSVSNNSHLLEHIISNVFH